MVSLQDNSKVHTSKDAKQFYEDFTTLDHPPYSPDLNPIEHVWAWMKRKLHQLTFKNCDEMVLAITQVWEELPLSHLQHYIDNFKRRIKIVYDNQGKFVF